MALEGQIQVSVTYNALGMPEQYTYAWSGGPLIEIWLRNLSGGQLSSDKKFVTVGPYKMRVLSRDYSTASLRCVRVGYPFWRVIAWAHQVSKLARVAYARVIITLAVWGLAQFDASCEPSIRDVYLVRWFLRKLSHGIAGKHG